MQKNPDWDNPEFKGPAFQSFFIVRLCCFRKVSSFIPCVIWITCSGCVLCFSELGVLLSAFTSACQLANPLANLQQTRLALSSACPDLLRSAILHRPTSPSISKHSLFPLLLLLPCCLRYKPLIVHRTAFLYLHLDSPDETQSNSYNWCPAVTQAASLCYISKMIHSSRKGCVSDGHLCKETS